MFCLIFFHKFAKGRSTHCSRPHINLLVDGGILLYMMERKMAAEKNVPSPGSPVDFWDGLYKAGTMPWDAGASPRRLTRFLEEFSPECASRKSIRVLVPGCGSAYEAAYLASQGYEVEAIDFSEEAIKRAKVLFKDEKVSFEQADFFEFDGGPFDLIYERAFLCSFNPKLRQRFVRKLRSLRPSIRML